VKGRHSTLAALVIGGALAVGLIGQAGPAVAGPNGDPVLRLCYVTRAGRCTGEGPWTETPRVDPCSAQVLVNRWGNGDAVWIDDSIGATAQNAMLACERGRLPARRIFVGVAQGHRAAPPFAGATMIAEYYPYGGTPPGNFWHQSIRGYWGCPPRYGIQGFMTQATDFHWRGSSPPSGTQARREWLAALSCIARGKTAPMGTF